MESMMFEAHLNCNMTAVDVDNERKMVAFTLPKLNSPDMHGAIKLAKKLCEGVSLIYCCRPGKTIPHHIYYTTDGTHWQSRRGPEEDA